jgi:hypothetical protein
MGTTRRHFVGRIVVSASLAVAAAFTPATGLAKSVNGFTNFELAASPPHMVGTMCPTMQKASPCDNYAAEPAIRSDPAGNLYGSSEDGIGGGTDAWKSVDGGLHYSSLSRPDGLSQANNTLFAPGGGDTDLATATATNAAGLYNVYVASLTLANIDVSTSVDGGNTWALNPTSATIAGDDREWIAAEGASKVCISYHDVATFNIDVNCSYDAGSTFTQLGDAIDANHVFLFQNNGSGNLAIDPASHTIYQVFSGIANASETVCGTAGTCGYHAVWVAVSTDGGATFTDTPIYVNPNTAVGYNHQFVNVTLDQAGNVYAVFSDNHNVYYSFSTTQGASWQGPYQVSTVPAKTAIFPWAVAGRAGALDIVYYGTAYYDGANPPDNYPMSASWYVYFAQNLSATTPGSAFSQRQASPIIHYGGVCEGGVSCTGNRDLYDDFGVSASPTTGMASIIYSDDQYTNTKSSPPATYGCTPSTSNSVNCDHTSIATQTSGSGIF